MRETLKNSRRHAGEQRPAEPNARGWVTLLAPYREPILGLVTAVPFVALWVGMLLSLRYSYWLCLLSSAHRDLCGGRRAIAVPSATVGFSMGYKLHGNVVEVA
jgi:hypothetical protein